MMVFKFLRRVSFKISTMRRIMKKLLVMTLFVGFIPSLLYSQQCPLPKIHYNIRMFVDPNGIIARNLRGGDAAIERSLKVIMKKARDTLEDGRLVSTGFTVKRIDRDEYLSLVGGEAINPENFINTLDIPPDAEFLFDIVIGEDIKGLSVYGFLINVKTKKLYRKAHTYVSPEQAKRYVIASIIKLINELSSNLIREEGTRNFISAIIERTEQVVQLKANITPKEPNIRDVKFAYLEILDAKNYYNKSVFDYLADRAGFAVKVDKGRVVNGTELSGGYQFIRGTNPRFVIELPNCKEFDPSGQIYVNISYGYLCPRADVIVSWIDKVNINQFKVYAPLGYEVAETWKLTGKYTGMEFSTYQLHLKANCEGKIKPSLYARGMKVDRADWIGDNFLYDSSIVKPVVRRAWFTDCGILDPWKPVDKDIDHFYVVAFDNRKDELSEFGYFFGGYYMQNQYGEVQDLFDLIGFHIVGEKVKFGDYDVFAQSMITMDYNILRSFKPFSFTYPFSYTYPNSGCGDDKVNVTVIYKFTPTVDCGCVETTEETK